MLVPYLTAGFPDRERSLEAMFAVAEAGADVIELGIPFSDPMADGPTIQHASFSALKGGMTMEGTLKLLADFRSERDTPIVLFTYLNPVVRFGAAHFLDSASHAGAQGLLLTDLPVGADPELERQIMDSPLDLIRLAAPTTSPERLQAIASLGQGFLYYISRTGVTGAQAELRAELDLEIRSVRKAVGLPVAVGFGISDPEQAAQVAAAADGVVVGSALIQTLDRGGPEEAGAFISALREGMDRR